VAAADFTYRIAETREDVEGAVRLVYRNYIELGYCHLNRFEVHFYLFDVLPETRTLVALHGDRVVATLTLVFDSPLGLPSGKLYPAELEALRAGGRRVVEISKLSVDRDLGVRGLAVLKGIFRLAWLAASRVRGSTDFVIMVEPHHERFYANSLLFERAGELKPDPEAKDAPSVLLRLDLECAPERHQARFGEEAKPSNPYWFFCLAPEVAGTEAAARAADGRLGDMNKLLETGQRLPSPTPAERRYMDYRLFSIAFVTDKTCQEAERRARKGLFHEEIEAFERLLAALPPDYAPERRASIFLDLATAAWHCGLYERSLALARAVRGLTLSADLQAKSHAAAGLALYFLGQGNEGVQELAEGLAIPGISEFERARLLRCDGRLAIERFNLPTARRRFAEARTALSAAGSSPEADKARAMLAHNQWLLETKSGDFRAAVEALREGAPFLKAAAPPLIIQYHIAWAEVESVLGRPREALAHSELGLRRISSDSDPFNAAVLADRRAAAYLSLGELEAARRAADQNMALAVRCNYPGVIADALAVSATLLIAEDQISRARAELAAGLERLGDKLLRRSRASVLSIQAHLARVEKEWDRARELLDALEKEVRDVPEYQAYARYQRVEAELLAGNLHRARQLAEGLPRPEKLPGSAAYEAGWKLLTGVMAAADGRADEALALVEASLAIDRAGEARHDLANTALKAAEALQACALADRAPRVMELCRRTAAEVCASVRLPHCARRLRELG
jgi:tetratricopeptide (TPR) repeat protein